MSTPSCILLFLLCLSVHACSARRLGGAVNNKKKLHLSIENDMKNGFKNNTVVVLQAKSSSMSSKESRSMKRESPEESHAEAEVKHKTVVVVEEEEENEKGKNTVSVSWRVPRKIKHGEKIPGFNLDYSPPKTHPPSHN